jgi:hypothetical protein
MRISLRDLFWLVLIAAIGLAWRLQHLRVLAAFVGPPLGQLKGADYAPDYAEIAFLPQQLVKLQALSNQELISRRTSYYLHEMVRRELSAELEEMYHEFRNRAPRDPNDPAAPPVWDNRQMLTAWRRAEGKPDPIQIEIASIGKDSQGRSVPGPIILPRIRNVDVEGESFYSESSGSIPAGAMWRVQLTSARGQRVPGIDIGGFTGRGGVGTVGMLPSGRSEVCDFLLDARDYVKSPPPGRYTLVLVYAIRANVNDDDLQGRIAWKSRPVPVIVENLALSSTWELIRLPCVIFVITLLGCLAALAWQARRTATRMLNRRDWFALAAVLLLTFGWCADIFLLKKRLDDTHVGFESSWTMHPG